MARHAPIPILVVEPDTATWPRVEAFFQQQLAQAGAEAAVQLRDRMPGRAAGFEVVSFGAPCTVDFLLDRPALLEDLRRTAIVNFHGSPTGRRFGHLRHLLHRREEGLQSDGLWFFPLSWMDAWFQEPLDFPELGLACAPRPRRPISPDRTWDRRSIRDVSRVLPSGLLAGAGA